MRAIINGRIILKDKILENHALLYSDVIEGIIPAEHLPQDVEIINDVSRISDNCIFSFMCPPVVYLNLPM